MTISAGFQDYEPSEEELEELEWQKILRENHRDIIKDVGWSKFTGGYSRFKRVIREEGLDYPEIPSPLYLRKETT